MSELQEKITELTDEYELSQILSKFDIEDLIDFIEQKGIRLENPDIPFAGFSSRLSEIIDTINYPGLSPSTIQKMVLPELRALREDIENEIE